MKIRQSLLHREAECGPAENFDCTNVTKTSDTCRLEYRRGVQPTRLQRLFATNWPFRLTVLFGTVVMICYTGFLLLPNTRPSFASIAYFVFIAAVSGIVGSIITAAFGGLFLLAPLYQSRAASNGAPFQVGDEIIILSGTYRDRICTVSEVWNGRQQFRADLGISEQGDQQIILFFTEAILLWRVVKQTTSAADTSIDLQKSS